MNMAQMLRLFDMLFSIIMINMFKMDTVQDKMSYLSRKVEAKEKRINGNSRKKTKNSNRIKKAFNEPSMLRKELKSLQIGQ